MPEMTMDEFAAVICLIDARRYGRRAQHLAALAALNRAARNDAERVMLLIAVADAGWRALEDGADSIAVAPERVAFPPAGRA